MQAFLSTHERKKAPPGLSTASFRVGVGGGGAGRKVGVGGVSSSGRGDEKTVAEVTSVVRAGETVPPPSQPSLAPDGTFSLFSMDKNENTTRASVSVLVRKYLYICILS